MSSVAGDSPRLDDSAATRVAATPEGLTWALMWSQRYGIPVLPCDPATKAPLIAGGKNSASRDPAQIRIWWTQWPDAMIGGRTDGLVVLDLDAYKRDHLADLSDLGELPPTRVHSTPGHNGTRGRHLVFRDPGGAARSTVLGRNKTIDVRAGTSRDYIILPPSRNSSGEVYAVTDWRLPALAPGWLLSARPVAPVNVRAVPDLPPPTLGRTEAVVIPLAVAGMSEEDRSTHTYLIFRNGVRMGYTEDEIVAMAESDPVTSSRRAEGKRQSAGWWPGEIERCLTQAVAEEHYGDGDERPSTARILMRVAARDFIIGQTTEQVPYAVPRVGPRVAQMFRGSKSALRASLAATFYKEYGHPPSQTALSEVLGTLEGIAALRPQAKLPLRVARSNGELVLDLGRPDGQAVVIGAGDWKVVDQSPVLFTRTNLTAPLPTPVHGCKLKDTLLPMLNLTGPDRDLVVACILSWLWPDIAHPVIYLRGEQGTAKSTMAKLLRRMVDPSAVEMRRQPGKDEDFEITLSGQWGVILDNLSSISEWLSDAICTAVTGVGDIKRQKYADQDLSVLQLRRCFILTSIPDLMDRGDLIDRTCSFDLLPIDTRKTDTELESEWERVWPRALGALLDLAVRVLAVLPGIASSGKYRDYRLADFALIAASMDTAMGTRSLPRFAEKVAEGVRSAVESDPFAAHLIRLAEEGWEGTAHMLFETYKVKLRLPGADLWPKNPISMGMRIARISGVLRKYGVVASHAKGRNANVWTFQRIES